MKTGTKGKVGPKGPGVYRTGIADHLALTFSGSLGDVYSKHWVFPEPRYWRFIRDRRRSHTGDPPCHYKMRPKELFKAYILPI